MLSQGDSSDIIATYYLSLVGFAVLFYDYALTFGMEISGFWTPLQYDWWTAVFLLNRYVSLFGHIPVIVEMFLHHPTENICHVLQHYHWYLAVIIQLIIGVIMVARTYALWGCSRKILSFLVMIALVVIGFGMWCLLAGKSEPSISGLYPGIIGCQLGLPLNKSHRLGAAWAGVVLSDTIIFALTVYKSLRLRQNGHRTIVDVLLRDGAIYFGIMSITTSCNVVTYLVGRPFSRGLLTPITNVFSSVAATRLMLNIRRVRRVSLSGSIWASTTRHGIQFTSAIVNPGLGPSITSDEPVEHELEELGRVDIEE